MGGRHAASGDGHQEGLAYTEDYADENSGVGADARACGWRRSVGYDGPQTLCDYLPTLRKEGAHGDIFASKTVNTEVMAWVLALGRAARSRMNASRHRSAARRTPTPGSIPRACQWGRWWPVRLIARLGEIQRVDAARG